jgi:hypothetical protein
MYQQWINALSFVVHKHRICMTAMETCYVKVVTYVIIWPWIVEDWNALAFWLQTLCHMGIMTLCMPVGKMQNESLFGHDL